MNTRQLTRQLLRLASLALLAPAAVVGLLLLLPAGLLSADEPPAPARQAPETRSFEPIDRLVGRCWEGEVAPGVVDVQCFEWAVRESFIRNTHELHGPDGVYAGESFYGWDPDEERLRFWYFNSLGGWSDGHVEDLGDGAWVAIESYDGAGKDLELRTRMTFPDADRYTVVTEQRSAEDGSWRVLRKIEFAAKP